MVNKIGIKDGQEAISKIVQVTLIFFFLWPFPVWAGAVLADQLILSLFIYILLFFFSLYNKFS